ncbi:MAG: hypothetical protein ACLFR0_00390 [Alphaproteobacteria bacterium]
MGYVYPNNLMVRRSEKREMIKGAVLLGAFVLIIAGLFIASDYVHNATWGSHQLACYGKDASPCRIE